MSRREDILNSIWDDLDVAKLSPEAKLVYIWSWSNPRCNMAGLYRYRPGTAAMETRLSPRREAEVLAELEATRFLFYGDGVLFVRSRVKHLRLMGKPMAQSVVKSVVAIPAEHPMRQFWAIEYAEGRLRDKVEQYGLDMRVFEVQPNFDGTSVSVSVDGALARTNGRVRETNGVGTTARAA